MSETNFKLQFRSENSVIGFSGDECVMADLEFFSTPIKDPKLGYVNKQICHTFNCWGELFSSLKLPSEIEEGIDYTVNMRGRTGTTVNWHHIGRDFVTFYYLRVTTCVVQNWNLECLNFKDKDPRESDWLPFKQGRDFSFYSLNWAATATAILNGCKTAVFFPPTDSFSMENGIVLEDIVKKDNKYKATVREHTELFSKMIARENLLPFQSRAWDYKLFNIVRVNLLKKF